MKTATVRELKQALNNLSSKELLELCLRLSKFKKENKELLTYLLFEAADERAYIESVKKEVEEQFAQIQTRSYYFIKKGIRKILANLRKYIRYSQKKETEVELLIHFCTQLKHFSPSINRSTTLRNLYDRLIESIQKKILALHEDLQYDFGKELEELG